jgi:hypothetical protein
MRTLLLLLSLACAHQNPNAAQPAPSPAPMDAVQMRACDSCRHNLEICRQQRTTEAGAGSACMDQFMACLNAQQLDTVRCQGMN